MILRQSSTIKNTRNVTKNYVFEYLKCDIADFLFIKCIEIYNPLIFIHEVLYFQNEKCKASIFQNDFKM